MKMATPERMEWLTKSQPKFSTFPANFTVKQWNEVEDLLFACAMTIGVTVPPEPEMLQKMCKVLKEQCPDMNASELSEAFDMYAFQKLDFKSPHYNSFDLLLLGHITSSFKRYRAAELAKLRKITYTEPERTMKQELEYWERDFFEKFDSFKKTNEFLWHDHEARTFYECLEKMGIIDYSVETKKEIAADVMRDLKMRIPELIKKGHAKKDQAGSVDIDKTFFQRKCKVVALKNWLQEMILEESDIKSIIIQKLNSENNG